MKFVRYIDFFVQTSLFLAALVIFIPNFNGMGLVRVVLMVQLAVGVCQVLSSVISVWLRLPLYQFRRKHLVATAIYLIVLFIFPFHKYSGEVMLVTIMVPAWTLAIFYYILTALATFQRRRRQSGFLPHTSF